MHSSRTQKRKKSGQRGSNSSSSGVGASPSILPLPIPGPMSAPATSAYVQGIGRGYAKPARFKGIDLSEFGFPDSFFSDSPPAAGAPNSSASSHGSIPGSSTDQAPSSQQRLPVCLEREAIIVDLGSQRPPKTMLKTINLQTCIAVVIWTPSRAGIIHLNAQGKEREALINFLNLFRVHFAHAKIAIVGGDYDKRLTSRTLAEGSQALGVGLFAKLFDPVVLERTSGRETSHELIKLICDVFLNYGIYLDDSRVKLYIGENPKNANFGVCMDLNNGSMSVTDYKNERHFNDEIEEEFAIRGSIATREQKRRESVFGTPYHVMRFGLSEAALTSEAVEEAEPAVAERSCCSRIFNW